MSWSFWCRQKQTFTSCFSKSPNNPQRAERERKREKMLLSLKHIQSRYPQRQEREATLGGAGLYSLRSLKDISDSLLWLKRPLKIHVGQPLLIRQTQGRVFTKLRRALGVVVRRKRAIRRGCPWNCAAASYSGSIFSSQITKTGCKAIL